MITQEQVRAALRNVLDPEIGKPIEDLGMLRDIKISPDGDVTVHVLLTVAACPLRDRIEVAATLKNQIEAMGDDLLDHFVTQARNQGRSWTQIGEALGVTRQAAQQRHGGFLSKVADLLTDAKATLPGGAGGRFTKRARASVVAAQVAARDRHHLHLLDGPGRTDERHRRDAGRAQDSDANGHPVILPPRIDGGTAVPVTPLMR
jgi:hypothetical protein